MKSVLIGAVGSCKVMLEAMIDVGFPINYVFSLDENVSGNVSGYTPVHEYAAAHGIPYKKFRKINDPENVELIKELEPDYIFVIGLSQLVKKEIIDSAKIGVIGFHPTALPKMRGRAAVVWQILLGVHDAKVSLFFIDEGTDSGDILGQEPYTIEETDYALDVCIKIDQAGARLERRVLKEIMDGTLKPVKQNEAEATYLLKRIPEDGWIDWNLPLKEIHTLVRAVSVPYPGAFGMYDGQHQIIIWRAEMVENTKYIGINGQIAEITDDHMDIICKDGILRVTKYTNVDQVKLIAGHKLK